MSNNDDKELQGQRRRRVRWTVAALTVIVLGLYVGVIVGFVRG